MNFVAAFAFIPLCTGSNVHNVFPCASSFKQISHFHGRFHGKDNCRKERSTTDCEEKKWRQFVAAPEDAIRHTGK